MRLRGRLDFLFHGQGLIDEHVKNGLTDFTLMQVTALPLVELSVAGSGFKQPAVFNMMAHNESLHEFCTCK